MPDEILLSELNAGVLTLTLNRPKANAFNNDLIKALRDALKQAGKDEEVRVVLLTANGGMFSAGQDVKEFGGDGHLSFREHLQRTYNPLILAMRKLEKPIVCAVNGAVAGAALGIVLTCDLRIVSEKASFFVGFGGIGLAPDSAVSLMLPKIIGLGRAAEATFFNSPINAQQALDWGLANRLSSADSLGDDAVTWAAELAKGPVRAMGLTKRDFNKAHLSNLEEMLDYEAHIQEIAGKGPDHQEGLAAFLEKREADYIGQI